MSSEAVEPTTFEIPSRGAGGEDKGTLKISSENFDSVARYRLLKEAVVMHQANRRQGTHATLTRAGVKGSGKKPWRQKGTGHARSGSRKSPIWRGGGVVFGPQPRDYSYSINKKQRRLAVRSALFVKFRDGEVRVVDGLDFSGGPKTRQLQKTLEALELGGKRVLIGTGDNDSNLVLSARNIPKLCVSPLVNFNTYDILDADVVVLTQDAFDKLAGGALVAESSDADSSGADSSGSSE